MAAAAGSSKAGADLAIKTAEIKEDGRREARESEEATTALAAVSVVVTLPDGKTEEISVPGGDEVGRVKLLLAEKFELSAAAITLEYNGKPMLDFLSLVDHDGIEAGGKAEIAVKASS